MWATKVHRMVMRAPEQVIYTLSGLLLLTFSIGEQDEHPFHYIDEIVVKLADKKLASVNAQTIEFTWR